MKKLILYHGSDVEVKEPNLSRCKMSNDFGRAFYTTKNLELAKEWACKEKQHGYVSTYELNIDELKVLDLRKGQFPVLNWIATLLLFRSFQKSTMVSKISNFIIEKYSLNIEDYDLIIGYRADDSYFSFAEDFLKNSIFLRGLDNCLRLGNLGVQYAIRSEKCLASLKFIKSEYIDDNSYFYKFNERDREARLQYKRFFEDYQKDDIFAVDLIKEDYEDEDPRLR